MRNATERTGAALVPLALAAALISVPSGFARADSAIFSLHRAQEPCYDPDSAGACRAARYHSDLARSAHAGRLERGRDGAPAAR